MKFLIFNGVLESRKTSISGMLTQYLSQELEKKHLEFEVFNLTGAEIPLFDRFAKEIPKGVLHMNDLFQAAEVHFWLAPIYHGGIPGVMKNCLDWLEISAKDPAPYLTDKLVAMISWADGGQAMQGINSMDSIARALRAWPIPYSVAISTNNLFEDDRRDLFSRRYLDKLDLLLSIATTKTIRMI